MEHLATATMWEMAIAENLENGNCQLQNSVLTELTVQFCHHYYTLDIRAQCLLIFKTGSFGTQRDSLLPEPFYLWGPQFKRFKIGVSDAERRREELI